MKPTTNTPVTWLKPEMVCEVIFYGWTDEGLMRQPVFCGCARIRTLAKSRAKSPRESNR